MASRSCKKTVPYAPLAAGSLDLRTPLGIGFHYLFRYMLNIDSVEQGRLSRMPGWTGWMACESSNPDFNRGNLDLHDQLSGIRLSTPTAHTTADGHIGNPTSGGLGLSIIDVDDTSGFAHEGFVVFMGFEHIFTKIDEIRQNQLVIRGAAYAAIPSGTPISGQETTQADFEREPINHITQFTSACNSREFLAFTTTRIYLSTGTSANWRMLGFGFSGSKDGYVPPYGDVRWSTAQLGNYILMINDYDFVLSWRIGDGPDPIGGWSVKYVQSLLELDIRRAGCIASWNGFVLIGDVETSFGSECSRIYWCDFNNPMEWAPGGESLAGYVDLGKTDKVLRMETIGGQLKVYTTKAIYNVTLVGGEEVLRFNEIYRGPDALAFRFALANLGDSHIYLTNQSIVETQMYNNTPVQVDWIHRAAGAIFKGVPNSIVAGFPEPMKTFGPINVNRCNEIVMGWDRLRRQVWISWPTTTNDSSDYDGVRRISMVLSRQYNEATLVDHAFSAFTGFIPTLNESVRNWMVQIGACSQEQVESMILPYEGYPLNPVGEIDPRPLYLINPTEDPSLPVHENSVCAMFGDQNIPIECNPCFTPTAFAMASLEDLTIKQLENRVRSREMWSSITQSYTQDGYAAALQVEHSELGTDNDKTVKWIDADLLHSPLIPPLNVHAQIGVGGVPDCLQWFDSEPHQLACDTELGSDPATTRMGGSWSFPFYQTGKYISLRIFLSSGDATEGYNFEPTGGLCDFNASQLTYITRNACR